MVNPYTVQTGAASFGANGHIHEQLHLAQTVTCQVDVDRRNDARHRPKLKRFEEADHFSVILHRNELEEEDNECLFNQLNLKVPFQNWQKVEWYKTFNNAKRRIYTYDQIQPDQEQSVRNAVYWLKSDLLEAMNMNAPRPEYSLVIHTQ